MPMNNIFRRGLLVLVLPLGLLAVCFLSSFVDAHSYWNYMLTCSGVAANGSLPSSRGSPVPQTSGKPTPYSNEALFTSSNRRPIAPITSQINDNKNIVRRKLTGYVGFANLPNQWHRKSVRKGFNFNVMVVGMLSYLLSIHGGLGG